MIHECRDIWELRVLEPPEARPTSPSCPVPGCRRRSLEHHAHPRRACSWPLPMCLLRVLARCPPDLLPTFKSFLLALTD
jgi:hypothetical protein